MEYKNLNPGLGCLACASGQKEPHDCRQQRTLQKILYEAGVLRRYQLFDLERDWIGNSVIKKKIHSYVKNADSARVNGVGIHFSGLCGVGKTALACYILKEIAKKINPATQKNYTIYFITFAEMLNHYTENWYDPKKREAFTEKVKLSDFLVIDDLGKEFRGKTNLNRAALDDVLRFRAFDNRPTIITTNRSVAEIEKDYGYGVTSLILGDCINIKIVGDDFRVIRSQYLEKKLTEDLTNGIII